MNKGIKFAFLAALISGLSIFVNKFAVDAIKPPLYFTTFKNIAVGILIFSIILTDRNVPGVSTGDENKWTKLTKLTAKQIAILTSIGIIGGALPFYLFFTGLAKIPAINAAIIQKTLTFWVTLLAIPFLKEKLNLKLILGVALLLASNFIIGGFKGFQYSTGELYVLAATLFWAVETVIAKKALNSLDPDIVTLFRMGIGSIILAIATILTTPNLINKTTHMEISQIMWVILSILLLFMYVTTWYRALKYAPAITVTAVLVSATLVTNALTAIFVTHGWTLQLTLQALITTLGIYFAVQLPKAVSTEINR